MLTQESVRGGGRVRGVNESEDRATFCGGIEGVRLVKRVEMTTSPPLRLLRSLTNPAERGRTHFPFTGREGGEGIPIKAVQL
jgi:hypothetical protein